MGKKRKSSSQSEDTFKMKFSSDDTKSIIATFPSGYVPGKGSETLHAFDHAEDKSSAVILATVRRVLCYIRVNILFVRSDSHACGCRTNMWTLLGPFPLQQLKRTCHVFTTNAVFSCSSRNKG